MLQEEVEHATKMTIEKMGRTCPSSSPSQMNYFPIFMGEYVVFLCHEEKYSQYLAIQLHIGAIVTTKYVTSLF